MTAAPAWWVGAALFGAVALVLHRRNTATDASGADSGDGALVDAAPTDGRVIGTSPANKGGAAVAIYGAGPACCWRSRMSIDTDGAGPTLGDATHQAQTSLGSASGTELDATADCYVVLTPAARQATGAELGDLCAVVDLATGNVTGAIYGDNGGTGNHLGEASVATAAALGLPRYRGTSDERRIGYVIFPHTATADRWPRDTYRDEALAKFATWGGVDRLRSILGA